MLKQGLSQKLLQKLSPQQIQFIQLLQLNTSELEQKLEEEVEENPALEKETYEDNDTGSFENQEVKPDAEEREDTPEEAEKEFLQENDVDLNDYLSTEEKDSYSMGPDPDEEDHEIPVADTSSLYDRLTEQLAALNLSEKEELLARHLIGMIENDGYLRRPLKSIAYDLVFLNSIRVEEEELEKLLKKIQNFEPAGVGARNLQECLLIQLNRKKNRGPHVELAEKIVRKHVTDLGNRHYDKILKKLKITRDEFKEALEVIQSLNPKPGGGEGSDNKEHHIIPDFVVKTIDDTVHVSLNSKNAPELKVNKEYEETLKGYMESNKKDNKLKEKVQFIKQRLDNAKWFIDAIKQRQQTLLQTMHTIVDLQEDFFKTGNFDKINPMILKDVAERVNLDVSTVSRIVNSKYVQTDFGIFSLKEFFSESIKTQDGEEVSNIKVKQLIKNFVDNEDKKKPLTDDKLTEMVKEAGYNVARRTVAKYREQLGIQVARMRKDI